MNLFELKAGDTSPSLVAILKDSTGTPINLTSCTVGFRMSYLGKVIVDGIATVLDAPNGRVAYLWQSSDTEKPGRFRADFKITYADGKVASFPPAEFIEIVIH